MASPSRRAGAPFGRAHDEARADYGTFVGGAAVALLPGYLVLALGAVGPMRIGSLPATVFVAPWLGLGALSIAFLRVLRGRGYALACAGLKLFGLIGLVGAVWLGGSLYGSGAVVALLVGSSGVLAFAGTLLLNVRYPVRMLLPLTTVVVAGVGAYRVTAEITFRERLREWLRTPDRRLYAGGGAPRQAVSVVFYTDYQCPYSRSRAEAFERVLAAAGRASARDVAFETRHFPLDAECNAAVNGRFHEGACEAAIAVRLATEHGRSRPLERWLYANPDRLDRRSIGRAARSISDVTDYEERYDAVLRDLREEVARAVALGVRATPTVFVDGRLATGFVIESEIRRLLDFAERRHEVQGAVIR